MLISTLCLMQELHILNVSVYKSFVVILEKLKFESQQKQQAVYKLRHL